MAKLYKNVTAHLLPIIDVLTALQPFLLPPAIALVIFSLAAFVYYERRANDLRCWPRLSMVLALMVFVWAFLRRRYAAPLPHKPLLQRAPWLAYAVFTLTIALGFFYIEYGKNFSLHEGIGNVLDIKVSTWLFSFAIWHSIAHFYFDGFLWKMRLPQVRASL